MLGMAWLSGFPPRHLFQDPDLKAPPLPETEDGFSLDGVLAVTPTITDLGDRRGSPLGFRARG